MGLPRYLAASRIEDPERTALLAHELIATNDNGGAVCMLQIGRTSPLANAISQELIKLRRRTKQVVIKDRDMAQSDSALASLTMASAVWVFADDMIETFSTLFATQLAFRLRARSRAGLPVIGVGNGAVSLGGLLLASRICGRSQYDLVGGLGWAPRALLDSDAVGFGADPSIARTTVRSLPALLAIELGVNGAARVIGGTIESVGSEPIVLIGAAGDALMTLPLAPGSSTTIAPPPFVPFEQGLLPAATLRALTTERGARPASVLPMVPPPLRQAPSADAFYEQVDHEPTRAASIVNLCPMCKSVHEPEPHLELVA
jgi:hypothetical protein